MNAAETSASSAIAGWTPLAVVSRSRTTAEIDTFIRDVSTTRTNIAIASRIARSWSPLDSSGSVAAEASIQARTTADPRRLRHPAWVIGASGRRTPLLWVLTIHVDIAGAERP